MVGRDPPYEAVSQLTMAWPALASPMYGADLAFRRRRSGLGPTSECFGVRKAGRARWAKAHPVVTAPR
jgi:hypothetical protein